RDGPDGVERLRPGLGPDGADGKVRGPVDGGEAREPPGSAGRVSRSERAQEGHPVLPRLPRRGARRQLRPVSGAGPPPARPVVADRGVPPYPLRMSLPPLHRFSGLYLSWIGWLCRAVILLLGNFFPFPLTFATPGQFFLAIVDVEVFFVLLIW